MAHPGSAQYERAHEKRFLSVYQLSVASVQLEERKTIKMKTKNPLCGLLSGLLLLATGTFTTQAVVTLYGTRVAFDAAAGATTLLDFEAQNPGGAADYTPYNSALTIGSVTFTQPNARLFDLGQNLYNTAGTTGSYLNNNDGVPDGSSLVGVSFASPVYSIGMDLGYLYLWGGGTTADLTLSTGDIFILSLTGPLVLTSTPLTFFGFTSDVGITSLSFTDHSSGMMIDNFAYTTTAVPEPTTLALAGLSGLSLMLFRRQRR